MFQNLKLLDLVRIRGCELIGTNDSLLDRFLNLQSGTIRMFIIENNE